MYELVSNYNKEYIVSQNYRHLIVAMTNLEKIENEVYVYVMTKV